MHAMTQMSQLPRTQPTGPRPVPPELQLPRYHLHQQQRVQREAEEQQRRMSQQQQQGFASSPYQPADAAVLWDPPSRRSFEPEMLVPPEGGAVASMQLVPYVSTQRKAPRRHIMRHRGAPPKPINPNPPPKPPKYSVGVQASICVEEAIRTVDCATEEMPAPAAPEKLHAHQLPTTLPMHPAPQSCSSSVPPAGGAVSTPAQRHAEPDEEDRRRSGRVTFQFSRAAYPDMHSETPLPTSPTARQPGQQRKVRMAV